MTDQAAQPVADHLDLADVQRRIKAIFIGSVGNLVEWYDFYAYTAFALYFAPAFFPNSDPVVQQLDRRAVRQSGAGRFCRRGRPARARLVRRAARAGAR